MQTYLNTYFASCNGFSGFRSYYDEIFDPKKYDFLFILKGGPGTGKSTFMKKIADNYKTKAAVERIFCSSDKDSLDGVIVRCGKRSVAVIDGTAPHVKDPIFPGAIDEIINLGDFWDTDALMERREQIVSLAEEKSSHYKSAYRELYRLKNKYNAFLNLEKPNLRQIIRGRSSKIRVISSFSKDGYFRLESEKFWKRGISVDTDIFTASAFFEKTCFSSFDDGLLVFVSPLDENLIEGYYNQKNGELFLNGLREADDIVRLESAIEKERIENDLSFAAKEFRLASGAHFALEKIYTEKMDFNKMAVFLDGLSKKIESVLYAQ